LPSDPKKRLAIVLSLPDGLVQNWVHQIGFDETQALGLKLLERAPFTIRVNTLNTDRTSLKTQLEHEGASVQFTHVAKEALCIEKISDPLSFHPTKMVYGQRKMKLRNWFPIS